MTAQELVTRFPEIPADIAEEPILARFAKAFAPLLRAAVKPAPCAGHHDRANRVYLELVGPLAIYGYGLTTREKALEAVRGLLERHGSDPEGFARNLAPESPPDSGSPGCGG